MKYLLSLIGIAGSFFMMYYREKIGDLFGEADWMRKVGGIYMVVVYAAIFIFFWSLAELTNTTHVLFAPVRWLMPGSQWENEGDMGF